MTVVGYAAGAFDLFHVGHLNILRQARSQCDYLIAGTVSDEICYATKGCYPVVPLQERLEIVRHITYVDRAVAEVSPDRLQTWADVGFDVFFKGDDWKDTEKGRRLERDFATVGVSGDLFPVHRAHLEYCAAPSTGGAQRHPVGQGRANRRGGE